MPNVEHWGQISLFPAEFTEPPQPSHTESHIDCPACEANRVSSCDPDKLRRIPFSAAAEFWLETRKPYLKQRTFYNLQSNVRQLNRFFGRLVVSKIHIGHVREYQKCRLINEGNLWEQTAQASIINHEIVALQGILSRANEWAKIAPHYEPLPMPRRKKPKVMSDDEEQLLFTIAASNPDWALAYWVASITNNCGAAGSELRNLRLRDLHLTSRIPGIYIDLETAKNEFRGRMVTLNQTAIKQLQRCVERAAKLGSVKPEHYLFPKRKSTNHWEPNLPASASWLRRTWTSMTTAAGLPWVTPHCLRHQHATISLEAGESEFTVAKRLGHRNPTMLREVYGHGRQDSQLTAVNAIDPSVRFGPKTVAVEKVRAIR